MFIKTHLAVAVAVGIVSLLSACGGGGGNPGSTTTPTASAATTFPVQAALTSAYLHGLQQTLAVTGSVSGSGAATPITGSLTFTIGQPLSTTFNGATALQLTQTINGSLAIGGQAAPLNSSGTSVLSPAYAIVGSTSAGSYCVASTPGAVPVSASVGQKGDIVSMTCYADSSKSVRTGSETQSFATTAGSAANTLNFQITENVYNVGNALTDSSTLTYTINSAGVATLTQVQLQGTVDGVAVSLTAK